MAILRNGNPVDYKMLCNNVEIERTTYKGKEVWENATPFYWIKNGVVQAGMPAKWNVSRMEPADSGWITSEQNSISKLSVSGTDDSNRLIQMYTDLVNTQGNKFIEITINANYYVDTSNDNGGHISSFVVAGVEVKEQLKSGAIIKVDISNKTSVNLYMDMRAWSYNLAYFYIDQIRFYS